MGKKSHKPKKTVDERKKGKVATHAAGGSNSGANSPADLASKVVAQMLCDAVADPEYLLSAQVQNLQAMLDKVQLPLNQEQISSLIMALEHLVSMSDMMKTGQLQQLSRKAIGVIPRLSDLMARELLNAKDLDNFRRVWLLFPTSGLSTNLDILANDLHAKVKDFLADGQTDEKQVKKSRAESVSLAPFTLIEFDVVKLNNTKATGEYDAVRMRNGLLTNELPVEMDNLQVFLSSEKNLLDLCNCGHFDFATINVEQSFTCQISLIERFFYKAMRVRDKEGLEQLKHLINDISFPDLKTLTGSRYYKEVLKFARLLKAILNSPDFNLLAVIVTQIQTLFYAESKHAVQALLKTLKTFTELQQEHDFSLQAMQPVVQQLLMVALVYLKNKPAYALPCIHDISQMIGPADFLSPLKELVERVGVRIKSDDYFSQKGIVNWVEAICDMDGPTTETNIEKAKAIMMALQGKYDQVGAFRYQGQVVFNQVRQLLACTKAEIVEVTRPFLEWYFTPIADTGIQFASKSTMLQSYVARLTLPGQFRTESSFISYKCQEFVDLHVWTKQILTAIYSPSLGSEKVRTILLNQILQVASLFRHTLEGAVLSGLVTSACEDLRSIVYLACFVYGYELSHQFDELHQDANFRNFLHTLLSQRQNDAKMEDVEKALSKDQKFKLISLVLMARGCYYKAMLISDREVVTQCKNLLWEVYKELQVNKVLLKDRLLLQAMEFCQDVLFDSDRQVFLEYQLVSVIDLLWQEPVDLALVSEKLEQIFKIYLTVRSWAKYERYFDRVGLLLARQCHHVDKAHLIDCQQWYLMLVQGATCKLPDSGLVETKRQIMLQYFSLAYTHAGLIRSLAELKGRDEPVITATKQELLLEAANCLSVLSVQSVEASEGAMLEENGHMASFERLLGMHVFEVAVQKLIGSSRSITSGLVRYEFLCASLVHLASNHCVIAGAKTLQHFIVKSYALVLQSGVLPAEFADQLRANAYELEAGEALLSQAESMPNRFVSWFQQVYRSISSVLMKSSECLGAFVHLRAHAAQANETNSLHAGLTLSLLALQDVISYVDDDSQGLEYLQAYKKSYVPLLVRMWYMLEAMEKADLSEQQSKQVLVAKLLVLSTMQRLKLPGLNRALVVVVYECLAHFVSASQPEQLDLAGMTIRQFLVVCDSLDLSDACMEVKTLIEQLTAGLRVVPSSVFALRDCKPFMAEWRTIRSCELACWYGLTYQFGQISYENVQDAWVKWQQVLQHWQGEGSVLRPEVKAVLSALYFALAKPATAVAKAQFETLEFTFSAQDVALLPEGMLLPEKRWLHKEVFQRQKNSLLTVKSTDVFMAKLREQVNSDGVNVWAFGRCLIGLGLAINQSDQDVAGIYQALQVLVPQFINRIERDQQDAGSHRIFVIVGLLYLSSRFSNRGGVNLIKAKSIREPFKKLFGQRYSKDLSVSALAYLNTASSFSNRSKTTTWLEADYLLLNTWHQFQTASSDAAWDCIFSLVLNAKHFHHALLALLLASASMARLVFEKKAFMQPLFYVNCDQLIEVARWVAIGYQDKPGVVELCEQIRMFADNVKCSPTAAALTMEALYKELQQVFVVMVAAHNLGHQLHQSTEALCAQQQADLLDACQTPQQQKLASTILRCYRGGEKTPWPVELQLQQKWQGIDERLFDSQDPMLQAVQAIWRMMAFDVGNAAVTYQWPTFMSDLAQLHCAPFQAVGASATRDQGVNTDSVRLKNVDTQTSSKERRSFATETEVTVLADASMQTSKPIASGRGANTDGTGGADHTVATDTSDLSAEPLPALSVRVAEAPCTLMSDGQAGKVEQLEEELRLLKLEMQRKAEVHAQQVDQLSEVLEAQRAQLQSPQQGSNSVGTQLASLQRQNSNLLGWVEHWEGRHQADTAALRAEVDRLKADYLKTVIKSGEFIARIDELERALNGQAPLGPGSSTLNKTAS